MRSLALGVLCAMPLACGQNLVAHTSELVTAPNLLVCPLGSEGCSCTPGGGCDPGLYCDAGVCVSSSSGYDFEEDLLLEASPPAPTARASRPARFERGKRAPAGSADFGGYADAPAPAAETVDVASVAAGASEPRDGAKQLDRARQVIYTAALQVAVYDLDAAAELAEALPEQLGGWIESRTNYQITLRIKADRLFEAIERLSALGVVLDKALFAQDVTAEYTDLESRIRVLEQLIASLEAMLAMAKTVEEILYVRLALDEARLELASARARMRELMESIDFSTLTLVLTLRGPMDPVQTSNDPFPWVESLGVELTEYR
jgi:hypothetical protein